MMMMMRMACVQAVAQDCKAACIGADDCHFIVFFYETGYCHMYLALLSFLGILHSCCTRGAPDVDASAVGIQQYENDVYEM